MINAELEKLIEGWAERLLIEPEGCFDAHDREMFKAGARKMAEHLGKESQRLREALVEISKVEANRDAREGNEDLSYSGEIARKALEDQK